MKKIATIIVIALLSSGTLFANNSNKASVSLNKNIAITANANTLSTITITISDMTGKVVYTETITNDVNNENIRLNISNKLSKGIYNVTLVVNNQKITHKLVVQ